MKIREVMTNLGVGLIVAVVSIFSTWYLNDVYNQPKILYYSRPYYKFNEVAIGNMFLWNAGRKTDHDISITLDTVLKDQEIKIVDLVSSYKILHNDNKTTIVISELKPGEGADITFKDDPNKDDSDISSFISEYSNIQALPLASELAWWQSPISVIVFPILFLFLGCIMGLWLRLKKNCAEVWFEK